MDRGREGRGGSIRVSLLLLAPRLPSLPPPPTKPHQPSFPVPTLGAVKERAGFSAGIRGGCFSAVILGVELIFRGGGERRWALKKERHSPLPFKNKQTNQPKSNHPFSELLLFSFPWQPPDCSAIPSLPHSTFILFFPPPSPPPPDPSPLLPLEGGGRGACQ